MLYVTHPSTPAKEASVPACEFRKCRSCCALKVGDVRQILTPEEVISYLDLPRKGRVPLDKPLGYLVPTGRGQSYVMIIGV